MQTGYKLAADSDVERPWYNNKITVLFVDILRTLRFASWKEQIFDDPTLNADARKLLQPLKEWMKMVA